MKTILEKIAFLTDTHCGIRNNSEIFSDYQGKFYSEFFFPTLKKEKIKRLFHLGDYFDSRKNINFYVLQKNKEHFLDQLVENDIHMSVLLGNHDVFYKNSNSINASNLLFQNHKHVQVIDDVWTTWTAINSKSFLWIPWMNAENGKHSVETIQNSSANFLLLHPEIENFEMYKGVRHESGLKQNLFHHFDAVYCGHFHHKSSKNNIHYLGAGMEFTWADYDDPRGFHILSLYDDGSHEMVFYRNPFRMFHKIKYDDTETLPELTETYTNKYVKLIVVEKNDILHFDKYLDELQKQNPVEISIVENDNMFLEEDPTDDIETLDKSTIDLLCEDVQLSVNEKYKSKVLTLMRELYTESLTS